MTIYSFYLTINLNYKYYFLGKKSPHLFYTNHKKTIHSTVIFKMGRNVGIEPTHTGATIRRVNHFTNSAMRYIHFSRISLVMQHKISLSFVFLRKFLSIFYKVKFLLKFSLILPIIFTFKHANAEHL